MFTRFLFCILRSFFLLILYRRILPHQCLRSNVTDEELPGRAGSSSTQLYNTWHTPPVAPPSHTAEKPALSGRLPGKILTEYPNSIYIVNWILYGLFSFHKLCNVCLFVWRTTCELLCRRQIAAARLKPFRCGPTPRQKRCAAFVRSNSTCLIQKTTACFFTQTRAASSWPQTHTHSG